MKLFDLDGLRVWLGKPVQVTAQLGWTVEWAHEPKETPWSFIHLTPTMERFSGGNVIVTYSMNPDTWDLPLRVSSFQISKDDGKHWGRRYSVLMQHNAMVFLPKPNDSLLAIPSEFMPAGPGEPRTVVGPAYLFEHGGDRMVLIPDGVRIVDLPWIPQFIPSIQPPENRITYMVVIGTSLQVGGKILATGYNVERKDSHYRRNAVLFASEDGGYNWRYYSTYGAYDQALAGRTWYEGPNESAVIQLEDGDLMAVFRIGNGEGWHLRRNYSRDGGHTWSPPDVLPAWSVRPILRRLANGVIALTTGRPGIYLWLAKDPRAARWQKIDLMAYHNQWTPDRNLRIDPIIRSKSFSMDAEAPWPLPGASQTTSYTGIVETSPNHLLLLYDRDPEEPPANPNDLSRVFVLPVEIERQ